jgi:hypothetical protein
MSCHDTYCHDAAPLHPLRGTPTPDSASTLLLHLINSIIQRRRAPLGRTFNNASPISEFRSKRDVNVGEEALLERHDSDNELRTVETRAD